jgi:hypothetical protein
VVHLNRGNQRRTRRKPGCKYSCQILHPLEGGELVSVLHRNSGIPCGTPALASRHDTSGKGFPSTRHSDKVPVSTHRGRTTCTYRALSLNRERFTQARTSCLEPDRSVGKLPVGKPSLCRSRVPKPTGTYSAQGRKNGNGDPTHSQYKNSHSSRPRNGTGLLLGLLNKLVFKSVLAYRLDFSMGHHYA